MSARLRLVLHWLKPAALAAIPVAREVAFSVLEQWARRQRERLETEDGGLPPFAGFACPVPREADASPSAGISGPSSPLPEAATAFLARIAHPDNLLRSWRRLSRRKQSSPGADRQSVASFARNLDAELGRLSSELASGSYRPLPVLCWNHKKPGGGHRVIAIPSVRDRVAQGAIAQIFETAIEPALSEWSFSYRFGRGCHPALDEVDRFLKSGRLWIVRADVCEYFDRIPHQPLLEALQNSVPDEAALGLVRSVITGPRLSGRRFQFPDRGIPQGSPLSPLLANFYLDPIDRSLRSAGFSYLRYADDILIACETEPSAISAMRQLRAALASAELEMNDGKSQILHAGRQGFDFLGHRYSNGAWEPIPDRYEAIREEIARHLRAAGKSSAERLSLANQTWRGWLNFYSRCGRRLEPYAQWFHDKVKKFRSEGH